MGKMNYPKGRMVVVRDCTVSICNKNNPASVLLSTLLFWYDNPHIGDTYDADQHTFTMRRTQSAIAQQSCNQIDVKTIHDTAVPFLQLFGYLTVVEKMQGNLYTLHIDRIEGAYAAYEKGDASLKTYLKSLLQLESAPITISASQLESILINKRRLYFELERVLIATRADSNCKRGRKPKGEAGSEGKNQPLENKRIIENISREKEGSDELLSSTQPDPSVSQFSSQEEPIASPFSLEEQEVLSWLDTEDIPYQEKNIPLLKEQLAQLRHYISTLSDLHKMVEAAKVYYQGYRDPSVALGNLINKGFLKRYRQAQNVETSYQAPAQPEASEIASQRDCEALLAEIEQTHPGLVVKLIEGPCIALVYGEDQYRDNELMYVEIRSEVDWRTVQGDAWVMKKALAYGQRLVAA